MIICVAAVAAGISVIVAIGGVAALIVLGLAQDGALLKEHLPSGGAYSRDSNWRKRRS